MGYGGVWVITGMGYDRFDCRPDRTTLHKMIFGVKDLAVSLAIIVTGELRIVVR
jgi:hypothetical protein